ncbi:alpha/beta hydrolase [Dietzia cercidiphylli]|uniref:Alpha/beta hydrolase n=2 Tax=Dietzia cercidiphylli TaxID=498199 RepID=A0ABN2I7G0_9ACTN
MSPTHRPLAEHVLRRVIRLIGAAPSPIQRLIAGPPVRVDGQQLGLEAQVGTRLLNLGVSETFERMPLDRGRDQIAGEAFVFGHQTPVETVRPLTIPGPNGPIPARLYRPAGIEGPSAALVYLHGGGWVLGDLDSGDSVSRFLAAHTPLTVISIDYRLAPEHPFPAGLDDALAAFGHVVEHAAEYDLDPRAIAIGGESAGGNLAAVVALHRAPGWTPPAMQVLFNPVTDLSTKHKSYELFGRGFFLTEAQMDWYKSHYLADPEQALDPRVSPLLAGELGHAPPAYVVVAGFDVLRDEGERYAAALVEAGVDVTLRRHSGHVHGLINATGVGHAARDALLEAVGVLHTRLVARISPATATATGAATATATGSATGAATDPAPGDRR